MYFLYTNIIVPIQPPIKCPIRFPIRCPYRMTLPSASSSFIGEHRIAVNAFMLEMFKASCPDVDTAVADTRIQLTKTTDELEHQIVQNAWKWAADFAAACLIGQPCRLDKAFAKKVDKAVFDGCTRRSSKYVDLARGYLDNGVLELTAAVQSAERTAASLGCLCRACK